MFYWIYDYPNSLIGALFAVVFVGVTWLGTLAFRPIVRSWIHGERNANDMVGFAFSSFSVLYGLLLGLLAVAAYQNFSSVSDVVTKEASSLASLYRDIQGYPEPIRGDLQAKLREYTRFVIEESWPEQRKGNIPAGGNERVTAFFDDFIAFKPNQKSEEIIHAEAFRQFNNFVELRRERLANVTTGIPAVLWWVVAIGALLNIALVWLLDMEIHVHLILGGILSLFLGIVIFLIAAMDNPFRGDVSVGPDAFQLVYDSLMKPTATPQ
jgi:Protein of unknown function (DUF4239)